MVEAGRLHGLNRLQATMLLGDVNQVPVTTLWRYVEWVRLRDVEQDVSRRRSGSYWRRPEEILSGRLWQVPWRGGAYCARYEDVLLLRKFMRLEALAGPAALRAIGLEMLLAWAQLPAAEAAGWALFDKRSRGGKNRWKEQ